MEDGTLGPVALLCRIFTRDWIICFALLLFYRDIIKQFSDRLHPGWKFSLVELKYQGPGKYKHCIVISSALGMLYKALATEQGKSVC